MTKYDIIRPSPWHRFYGLLAFASFVFATAEAIEPPRDWVFISVAALAGLAFLTIFVTGHRR